MSRSKRKLLSSTLPWRPRPSPTGSLTTLVSLDRPSIPPFSLTVPFHLHSGEQHRIVARAQALRLALESRDPTIKHTPWTPPLVPANGDPSSSRPVPPAKQQDPKPENPALLERGEVTPYNALQSACLLLSAIFEKTPFNDTDIRKRVFADFAILKKEFRHSQLRTLHGPTTSVGQLFGAIKVNRFFSWLPLVPDLTCA